MVILSDSGELLEIRREPIYNNNILRHLDNDNDIQNLKNPSSFSIAGKKFQPKQPISVYAKINGNSNGQPASNLKKNTFMNQSIHNEKNVAKEFEKLNQSLQNHSNTLNYQDNTNYQNNFRKNQISKDHFGNMNNSPTDLNKTSPLPIYQMFFENMENIKHGGRSMLQAPQSQKSTQQSRFTSFKKNVPIKSANSKQNLVKSSNDFTSNVGDTSVKDIIDEGFKDIYEEINYPNDNILNSLYEPVQYMPKREQPVMDEITSMNVHDAPIDDFPFNDYINLNSFPQYTENPYLLYLKATSLFNNSLLFENDLFSILCKTDKTHYDNASQIVFNLTYHPTVPGVIISTRLQTNNDILSQPPIISKCVLSQDIEQSFTFQSFIELKLIDFPALIIEAAYNGAVYSFKIPLPYSINKYVQSLPITLDDAVKYLDHVI
jgi:hypothetical protein